MASLTEATVLNIWNIHVERLKTMKIAELEKKIDLFSLIEEQHNIKRFGKYHVVNPCPIPLCGKRDHFVVYKDTNSYCSFSNCCQGGGVYKYLQEVEGLSEEHAYERLNSLAGEAISKSDDNFIPEKYASTSYSEIVKVKSYTNWITDLFQKQTHDDKLYFYNRGIPIDLINKYKLCISHEIDGRRAVLPIWSENEVVYYTARALDGQKIKYKNAKGSVALFSVNYLKEKQNSPIFITEGIFDALTLEYRGYKAIALGGVEHASKLSDAINKNREIDNIFITAFDNDKAGREAAAKLPYKRLEIPASYKDLNEWHLADLKFINEDSKVSSFDESVKKQLKTVKQPDSVYDYLDTVFDKDIEEFLTDIDKKTGFTNLDKEMQGLYPGLYVIGGIPSIGKTTLVHQLGDQLAEQGEHVIYFSLEQSRFELVSKSLARTTAQLDINSAMSNIQIRTGNQSEALKEARKTYRKIASKVNVVAGNFNTDVNSIKAYVEHYIKVNNVRPTIIIDYLQIMPGTNDKLNDKQRIDMNVKEIKRMSRDFNITILVISSLNRGNYLAPIDFESFKESGGIEYTADVVWGVQLEAINDELFEKKDKIKEKRAKLLEAKAAEPRKIELICLKNRNGKPSFTCSFNYWPSYDFFEPNLTRRTNTNSYCSTSGFEIKRI